MSDIVVYKCNFKVFKLHKNLNEFGDYLINPSYLKDIIELIDTVKRSLFEITIPGFTEDTRFLPDSIKIDYTFYFDDKQEELNDLITQLEWDEIINEAQTRLKNRFNMVEYLTIDFSNEITIYPDPIPIQTLLGQFD